MSRAFDVSDRFWLNLQNRFDLEKAKDSLENELMNISPLPAVLAN
jgi:plasmid maintenance system antidote protein VapI